MEKEFGEMDVRANLKLTTIKIVDILLENEDMVQISNFISPLVVRFHWFLNRKLKWSCKDIISRNVCYWSLASEKYLTEAGLSRVTVVFLILLIHCKNSSCWKSVLILS